MKKTKAAGTGARLKTAFIMDPIERINLETDTTFLLMLEAQVRGHEVYYILPGDVYVDQGAPRATACRAWVAEPGRPGGEYYELDTSEDMELAGFDLIFNRVDPPYDISYVTLTQVLGLVPAPAVVVNRPAGVLQANEKLLALRFPEFMPATIVTRDPARLRAFLLEIGGKAVVKPLAGFGGIGVVVVEYKHTNANVLIETMTEGGARAVMAQKFLPVSTKGDKRIIMLAGEPIGAMLRLPAKGDHRANLHSGGRAAKAVITARDRAICSAVGPLLKNLGLWVAGLDIVAGYLTEINFTSPTLVKQINRFEGVKLEARVLDFCEFLADAAKRQGA